MRLALCVRYQELIYRLVWLNESKAGIYVGVLGSAEDSHVSYHRDGTHHIRLGKDYHNRYQDKPIAENVGSRQLGHYSLSLTKEWFNPKTLYGGDKQTESVVLIDERLLSGKDTLALDVWLTDRRSEHELLRTVAKHVLIDKQFQLVAELVSALDHFPDHKLAMTLRSARIRDLEPDRLMFPATEA